MPTTLLTSYKDTKYTTPFPIGNIGADTKAGMQNCAIATRLFAESADTNAKLKNTRSADTNPKPENTRSDPADRIRRFREDISWSVEESKDTVRASAAYKKSACFLIQCVLSSIYGEEIKIDDLEVTGLSKGTGFPGRQYFIDSILNALDPNISDPNKTDKWTDKIRCLRRDGVLVGLLSRNGPIPVVEKSFTIAELKLDENKSIEEIINGLKPQDKTLLMLWLRTEEVAKQNCKLYDHIREILTKQEKISDAEEDFVNINKVLNPGDLRSFPQFKDNSSTIMLNRLCLFPLRDKDSPFGYGMPTLTIEADQLWYVLLVPFTKATVDKINDADKRNKPDDFMVKSVECLELTFDKNKLVSVTLRCELINQGLSQIVSKLYSGQQFRYLKGLPSLTVYGPVPKHGWIARRDVDLDVQYPSPLFTASEEKNINIKDIKLDLPRAFETTGENYTVYHGEIPQWLGIDINDDRVGALPLRIPSKDSEKDWLTNPNFIQKEPPSGTITVAVDIGSSRSAILFHNDNDAAQYDSLEKNKTFIRKNQPLGIPITSLASPDSDAQFGIMYFLPDTQYEGIVGKTPVGLLTTNKYQGQSTDAVALYESGKLIMLDPKSISESSTRRIMADIKVGNDPKALNLFARGMLTRIIDRAVHLECKTIKLRLSYITERYSSFKSSWKTAVDDFQEKFPTIQIDSSELLYLPESLSIANYLKWEGQFQTASGAAIIDVGDFTTDFAIFMREGDKTLLARDKAGKSISRSILFAGRQIIIQPIWDYLLFSRTKIEDLFNADSKELQDAVKRIETARTEAIKSEKIGDAPEDVRRDILCLMKTLKKDKIRPALQNLFDICYLAEIVLLKRLLRDLPKNAGAFTIKLFGGGSTYINTKKDKLTGYGWDIVLGRDSIPENKSDQGEALAIGLLRPVHKDLEEAKEEAELKARDYKNEEKQALKKEAISDEELRIGYLNFLRNAQALKKWEVLDKGNNNVSTGKLFNVKKPSKDLPGEIEDSALYSKIYADAIEYANAGSETDKEIRKVLFAYKMAYKSAVEFYSKGAK
ncbi:hypothetical protein ACYULU_04150 [Breznakiellaceae bacterium SP9]